MMHTLLLILKIAGVTLGVLGALIVIGAIALYALSTSGGRNPFQ